MVIGCNQEIAPNRICSGVDTATGGVIQEFFNYKNALVCGDVCPCGCGVVAFCKDCTVRLGLKW